MEKNGKKEVALFRFSVISDIVSTKTLDYGEQAQIIREKCARRWMIPFSEKTHIGRSCILRWLRLYKQSNGKIESLYPKQRSDIGKSRALDEETCLNIIRLRKEIPTSTVPYLIKEMEKRKLVTTGTNLKPTTIYRFLNQEGLMKKPTSKPQDCRKFEAELPNDLWQSDVMHGPRVDVDGKLRKTYLIAIIDDHSRLIPHARFYLSEALPSYLCALEGALITRGLPRKLYVDNGPAFRSRHLEYVTASLNIALIHAKPYKPQGKGKIERWFKTIRSSFLPGFKGSSLQDLNEAIENWVTGFYHMKKHGSTGQTPFERFTSNMECLRPAPENLKDHFRKVIRRKVAKDRTVIVEGRLFEAPVPLIGQQVELVYHDDNPEDVEIRWNGKTYGLLRPTDLHVNCRVKRDENNMNDVMITVNNNDYTGGKLI